MSMCVCVYNNYWKKRHEFEKAGVCSRVWRKEVKRKWFIYIIISKTKRDNFKKHNLHKVLESLIVIYMFIYKFNFSISKKIMQNWFAIYPRQFYKCWRHHKKRKKMCFKGWFKIILIQKINTKLTIKPPNSTCLIFLSHRQASCHRFLFLKVILTTWTLSVNDLVQFL